MTWPTPQDYQEAIQSPRLCFSDPELQRGTPRLDSLGLPKPNSGNFASVYEISDQGKRWAVRCFSREFSDQQQRYEKISQHLHQVRLPYTVDFKFQAQGIKVKGRWYPILKMEWVDGTPLITFIEQNITRPEVLRDLACKWIDLIAAMRQSSVAHGDLQHGNIIVAKGHMQLIDYDGMFVPGLAGYPSHEVGHPSYQHPLRTQADFDLYLDNFSAWVIYLSLVAVALDPQLWTRMGAGDREERLLFRRGDFDPSKPSPTLSALKQSSNAQIRALANSFESLLYMPPSEIPSLDGTLVQIQTPLPRPSTLPDWVIPPPQEQPRGLDEGVPDSTWLIDHLPRRQPASLDATYALEHAVLGILATTLFAIAGGVLAEWLSLQMGLMLVSTETGLTAGLLGYRYRSLPSFKEKAGLMAKSRATSKELYYTKLKAQGISNDLDRNARNEESQVKELKGRQQKLAEKEKMKVERIEKGLQVSLDALNGSLQTINREESDALQRSESQRLTTTNDLNRKRQDILNAQSSELDNALAILKQTYLRTQLTRFAIRGAELPSIGLALRESLARAGITTAAEVEYLRVRRVHGIGSVRSQVLVDWRRDMERKAMLKGGPAQLDQATQQDIKNRYYAKIQAITAQETLVNQNARDEQQQIRTHSNSLRQQIYTKRSEEQSQAAQHIESIRTEYSPGIEALSRQIQETISSAGKERTLLNQVLLFSRKSGMEKQFSLARMQFELTHYKNISFANYLKRLVS